jgi:protein gp37
MATDSKIEWTEHTDNLWHGCTKVHAGCDHCYAETLTKRWKRDIWGNDKPRMEIKSVWNDLKKQQAAAAAAGEMHRVFVGSMMDIFEKPMPLVDHNGKQLSDDHDVILTGDMRNKLFSEITTGKYPNLIFLFLTKRPSNINKMIPETWRTDPPPNVMFGTSPCDQATANTLIPQLLKVKGKKFLSCEPLLGPINLLENAIFHFQGFLNYVENGPRLNSAIDWVIVGGESGHHARPIHPDWVRSLRDQCNTAGIPFFFKQWGEYYTHHITMTDQMPVFKMYRSYEHFAAKDWVEKGDRCISIDGRECKIGKDFMECNYPVAIMNKVGKKEAGRMLDGNEYSEFPWQLFEIIQNTF